MNGFLVNILYPRKINCFEGRIPELERTNIGKASSCLNDTMRSLYLFVRYSLICRETRSLAHPQPNSKGMLVGNAFEQVFTLTGIQFGYYGKGRHLASGSLRF